MAHAQATAARCDSMRNALGAWASEMPELSTETPSIIQPRVLSNGLGKKETPVRIQSRIRLNAVHGRVNSVIRRRKRGRRRSRACLNGLADAHLLPVIAKLLAAVETHDIRAVAIARRRHLAARR